MSRVAPVFPHLVDPAGADWLRHLTEHRFFPELWSVRTSL